MLGVWLTKVPLSILHLKKPNNSITLYDRNFKESQCFFNFQYLHLTEFLKHGRR